MARSSIRVESRSNLSPAEIEEVWQLLCTVSEADAHPPLGEHRWVDLVHGGRGAYSAILAHLEGHDHDPVGYAQVSGVRGNWSIDLVVHPHHRPQDDAPNPLAVRLLEEALQAVRIAGGGHVHYWVPKPHTSDDAAAAAAGLSQGRDLLQLRRPLPLEKELADQARGLEVRSFVPDRDSDAWLDVNNRAFAWHPEQGEWTPELLHARMEEPWFDSSGFLLHEIEGRLAGFCWTKVHAEHDPPLGEIYVIAVDPDFRGRGLGRKLTLAGLKHLSSRRLRVGMLYVDASNSAAVSMYDQLGFELDHVDRAYVGDVEPAPTSLE